MMDHGPKELYPVGTDICDMYGFKDTATTSVSINTGTGELYTVASSAYWTSAEFAPINPSYTYAKKYYRLYRVAYYDNNYNFIGYTESMNNTIDGDVLTNIPSDARYVRIAMYHPNQANYYRVGLVRTA